MTANQCERPNLPNPPIYEASPVCSLRSGTYYGISLQNTISSCCTASNSTSIIKFYQCWNYCLIPETQFPTWMSCVETALNETKGTDWGAACQRADQSPVSTATMPYPASYDQPENPNWYTKREEHGGAILEAVTTLDPGLGGGNAKATATAVGLVTSPTMVNRSEGGGRKTVEMSVGGLVCALLMVSAFVL